MKKQGCVKDGSGILFVFFQKQKDRTHSLTLVGTPKKNVITMCYLPRFSNILYASST